MRIIVADDDRFALETLADTLRADGHEVIKAHDGLEALAAVREDRSRMVISDWIMPGMDGVELCRAIRTEDLPGYVYVILLTSHHATADIVTGLTAGADDYLGKPFHPEELKARVRAADRVLSLETRDVAIFAMAKLAESRDPETGMHLERIRSYSRILTEDLARQNALGDVAAGEYVRLIHLTSPLHDIGKVGIPDSVLLKPGRLSDREFEIMKTHTTIGADTLQAAMGKFPGVRYLTMARDIALTHHERYDGTGYPHGRSGDDIPLCGRIVALADVYDALTSRRTYKDAFTHDVARTMIIDERGSHFDPLIVDAFERCEALFIETRRRFQELELVSA